MSGGSAKVRDASESDAQACAEIYAPYVTETAVSFETDPPPPTEMAQRIAIAVRIHAWVVLENEAASSATPMAIRSSHVRRTAGHAR